MNIKIHSTIRYLEIVVSGSVADGDTLELAKCLEAYLSESSPESWHEPCVLWNLKGIPEIPDRIFSIISGYSVLYRLAAKRVFVVGHREILRRYLDRARIPALVSLADNKADALKAMSKKATEPTGEGLAEAEELETVETAPPSTGMSPASHRNHLGQILLDLRMLTESQLKQALEEQRHGRFREKLGAIIHRMGFMSDEKIFAVLQEQYRRRALQEWPRRDWSTRARQARKTLLGEMLVQLRLLSQEELDLALEDQWRSKKGENLGQVLLRRGVVTREQLFNILETQSQIKET